MKSEVIISFAWSEEIITDSGDSIICVALHHNREKLREFRRRTMGKLPSWMADIVADNVNGYIKLPVAWAPLAVLPRGCDYLPSEWDAHGGWTFMRNIREEELGSWPYFSPGVWIGFDTMHAFDDETTKSKEFVVDELHRLMSIMSSDPKFEGGPDLLDLVTIEIETVERAEL